MECAFEQNEPTFNRQYRKGSFSHIYGTLMGIRKLGDMNKNQYGKHEYKCLIKSHLTQINNISTTI